MNAQNTVYLTPHPHTLGPPSRGLVLTPNPRAAEAWGASPLSLDGLARRLLRDVPCLIASSLVAHRTLRRAVREVLAPEDLEGSTRVLAEPLRALLRANLSAARERATGARAQELCALGEHYRALLEAQGLVDAAEALWRAAALKTEPQQLHVRGYPRLGEAELVFLNALAGDGSSLVLPGGEADLFEANHQAAQRLEQWGWHFERQTVEAVTIGEKLSTRFSGERGDKGVDLVVDSYPHLEAEVRGALHHVKTLLHRGVRADDIVLVSRDELLYGPIVRAVAREFELPVRTFDAVPVSDTQLGGWLKLMSESVKSGGRFEPTARLLGHGLSGGVEADTWRAARREHPDSLAAWRALGVELGVLAWPDEAGRADYVKLLRGVLEHFGIKTRNAPLAREKTAFHKLQRALNTLASPAEERVSQEQFLGELLGVAPLLYVLNAPSPTGDGGAVALHTPLALFGARYPHVMVLGLAEGVFPAALRDDPVLDFYARKQLRKEGVALEDAREAAERERLSFWALLQVATQTLHLSYPTLIGDQPQLPGAHVSALDLSPRPAPERSPASPEEARRFLLRHQPDSDPVLSKAHHAWQVELRRESAAPHDAHDGIIGVARDPQRHTFSASQFMAIGQCPFRWFAARLLKLAEPEEAEDELAPDVRGRFYHKVLELTLAQAVNHEDPRGAALVALDACFVEAEKLEAMASSPNWQGQRREHLELLRRALEADDFFVAGAKVTGLEQYFEGRWHGLGVRGVVDRIDERSEGLVLTDYKTRKSKPGGVKDASGRAKLDVQLPLYLQAAAPALYPGRAVVSARYYSLTAPGVLAEAQPDDEALQAFAAAVKEHLQRGAYPVDPDEAREACAYCEFDALCRQGPRIERKRHAEP